MMHGVDKLKIHNYFKIPQKIIIVPRNVARIFSGSWKCRRNLRALRTVYLFVCIYIYIFVSFSQAGVPQDMNNCFRGSPKETNLRNAGIQQRQRNP